jgi:hypothetical protein
MNQVLKFITVQKASKKIETYFKKEYLEVLGTCRRPQKGEFGVHWARKMGKDNEIFVKIEIFEACDSVYVGRCIFYFK